MENIISLEKKLTITFRNKALIKEALTHPSVSIKPNNERLEFFGDAVLKLIASEYLFTKYPEYDEGDLTTLRSKLISDHNLAKCATDIQLGDMVYYSEGEINTGGRSKKSNLANAYEALLGAIYFDQGLKKVETFLIPILEYAEINYIQEVENFKSKLQEILHKTKEDLPEYTITSETGPDHDKEFLITVKIKYQKKEYESTGTGKTKKDAEQVAAKAILSKLSD